MPLSAPNFLEAVPAEGYQNFMKQVVPRWTTTDAATIAAYTELVDRVCPCVVLVHSQTVNLDRRLRKLDRIR